MMLFSVVFGFVVAGLVTAYTGNKFAKRFDGGRLFSPIMSVIWLSTLLCAQFRSPIQPLSAFVACFAFPTVVRWLTGARDVEELECMAEASHSLGELTALLSDENFARLMENDPQFNWTLLERPLNRYEKVVLAQWRGQWTNSST